MNWSNNWSTPSDIQTNIDAGSGKSFSEVLREHNAKGDALIKEQYSIDIDYGNEDKTSVFITKGSEVVCVGLSIELSIPVGWKIFKANAIQIGDLAVVISTDDPDEHCMVHVPTQTWFDNAIPDGEWTVEQLCLWAWKVQEKFKSIFNTLSQFNNFTYKDLDKKFMEEFKCLCLSVPVL